MHIRNCKMFALTGTGDKTMEETKMSTNRTRYFFAWILGAALMILSVPGISEANRSIIIEGVETFLYIGEKTTAKATVECLNDEAPSKTTIVWSSSDEEVVAIDSKGNIKAVSAGTAVITGTAKDDESITASVEVVSVVPVSAIKLNSDKEALLLSDACPEWAQVSLAAVIEPADAYHQDVVWSSSDETIATVDENGNVQAHAIGKATITATSVQKALNSKKGPEKASCVIEVGKPVESISISETDLYIAKGQTAKLNAEVFPEDATDRSVTWYSANPQIVSIEKQSLKAKACGSCDVFCIANDGSEVEAKFTVHVEQTATGIQFENKSITLYMGDQVPVSYTVLPEDTTDPSVSWRSSDHSIVTISSQGLMTPRGTGKCTITAYTNDGSGKSASFSVFVPTLTPLVENEITLTRLADAFIQYETHTSGEVIGVDSPDVCDIAIAETDEETGRIRSIQLLPHKVGTSIISVADEVGQNEGLFKVKVHVTRDVLIESDAIFNKTMMVPFTSAKEDATVDLYCGNGLTRGLFTMLMCVDFQEAQKTYDINLQYPSYVINPKNSETLYLLCRGEKQTTLMKYSFVTKEGAYYISNSIDDFDYIKTLYEDFGYSLHFNQTDDLMQAVELIAQAMELVDN